MSAITNRAVYEQFRFVKISLDGKVCLVINDGTDHLRFQRVEPASDTLSEEEHSTCLCEAGQEFRRGGWKEAKKVNFRKIHGSHIGDQEKKGQWANGTPQSHQLRWRIRVSHGYSSMYDDVECAWPG